MNLASIHITCTNLATRLLFNTEGYMSSKAAASIDRSLVGRMPITNLIVGDRKAV